MRKRIYCHVLYDASVLSCLDRSAEVMHLYRFPPSLPVQPCPMILLLSFRSQTHALFVLSTRFIRLPYIYASPLLRHLSSIIRLRLRRPCVHNFVHKLGYHFEYHAYISRAAHRLRERFLHSYSFSCSFSHPSHGLRKG